MANIVFYDKPPLARAYNTFNGSDTVSRCFQKAGFIIPEVPLIDEVDEDADDDPLLSMEADVSTPLETNDAQT